MIIFDKLVNTPAVDKNTPMEFREYHYNKDRRYHLVNDGIVVGGVDLDIMEYKGFNGENIYLYCLEIYAPFRRKGYGKILLEEIEKVCKEMGVRIIGLNVDKDNFDALRLYQRDGYEIITQLDGRAYNQHCMRKFISEGAREQYLKKFEKDYVW